MLSNFLVVTTQVGVLFLLMAVGYVLARLGKLSRETVPQITFLLLHVVLPCLVINSFQIEYSPELLRAFGVTTLVVVAGYVVYALLIIPFFRKEPEGTRTTLQFGAVYGNIIYMGMPLILAVLGDEASPYAAVSFAVFTGASWTHGLMLMAGRKNFSIKSVIANPGVLGAVVGIVLFLGRIRLPVILASPISFLGSMNTPLGMIVIGAQMAWADLPKTFRNPLLYGSAAIKLLLFPLITMLALLPFRFDPVLYSTVVILSATPTAGVTAMFAVRYHRDAETAAQLVTLTTLLSIVTLPLFGTLAAALTSA